MKKGINTKARTFANALAKINTEQLYLKAVNQTSDLALDLNRLQLQALGIDAKGKSLGKYSETTKKIKQKKGQETDHITLLDTGSFQEKFFINAKRIPIFIESSDSKTGLLEQKYGEAILGLTPSNLAEYKKEVMKVYKELLHAEIQRQKKILQ